MDGLRVDGGGGPPLRSISHLRVSEAAVEADLHRWLAAALTPQPMPSDTSSREIVRQAIRCAGPPRLPYSFVEPVRSDFFELSELERLLDRLELLDLAGERPPGSVYRDAWGVGYQAVDGPFDRAVDHPLADLGRLDADALSCLPDVAAPERLQRIADAVERAQGAGKYVVAADPVLLFERLQALVGFETLMTAPWKQRAGLERLLERLTDLTLRSIEAHGKLGGVDAFMTWQDFAHEAQMVVSPASFREIYAPHLARMVKAAHGAGMHFIWHCCGQVAELIPEMIAMGVDVVQLDQPRLLGHRRLAEEFGGRICFWNAVDTQWSANGNLTAADLRAEVAAMTEPFHPLGGGFMARHYPQPGAIGLSRRFHEITSRAFLACQVPQRASS